MAELVALLGFSFVSSVTPGPNNLLLWGSGATFGFRRTLRHVAGTALGLGAMALGVAAGVGTVIATVPGLEVAMKLGGSLYLVHLAWQIAGVRGIEQATVARPLGVVQAAALQLINPKAWIFAIGAVTTFRPPDVPVALGSVLVAATMMAVIAPTAALWAAGGGLVARFVTDERAGRAVSIALGALLALSVVFVWL